jgi:hypothetical protein
MAPPVPTLARAAAHAAGLVETWTGAGASSHRLGLDDAIALATALDRMPGRLTVHAIEAAGLTRAPA